MFKPLKEDEKYSWTYHVGEKMRYYGIGEGRVKRIIRFPKRTEEGIVEDTIAVMQPAGTKRYQEIWVMYRLMGKKIKVITAWRYPGKSPARDPIPTEVIEEVRKLI
jgi:hypothetical protein